MRTRDRIMLFLRACEHSPSVREIGSHVGLSSPASVHRHLGNLERDGVIQRVGPNNRIRVTR